MECVATIGGDFNEALPYDSVTGEALRVGGEVGGFSTEDGSEHGEVWMVSDAGVEFPVEAGYAASGFGDCFWGCAVGYGIEPVFDGDDSLGGVIDRSDFFFCGGWRRRVALR